MNHNGESVALWNPTLEISPGGVETPAGRDPKAHPAALRQAKTRENNLPLTSTSHGVPHVMLMLLESVPSGGEGSTTSPFQT